MTPYCGLGQELGHVARWEPYDPYHLCDLARVSCVGSVYTVCIDVALQLKAAGTGSIVSVDDLYDLDRDM